MSEEESYRRVLRDNNLTEEQVQQQIHTMDVLDELSNMYVGDSTIHGKGCFTSRKVNKGCIICPARIKHLRTLAGRYCNHAENPNAFSKFINGSFVLITRVDIEKGDEVTLNYQQVINENSVAQ